jgi:methylglutaconyl-CoA hydratase
MKPVLITDSGAVRRITLNRPDHRNALTPEMQHELIDALDDTARSRALRVLVITGAGQAFCAGLDLASLRNVAEIPDTASPTRMQLADNSHRIARILRTLYELPLPTIAAVNGHAIAGGAGIASVCDFTLAVPEAKFGYSEVKIGFVPAVVSAFLALQVGEKRCRDLLLTGRVCSAEEGLQMGVVTEMVAAEALEARTQALAETLIANSPTSLCITKALLADQNRAWLDRAINLALEASTQSRRSKDFHEGIAAFLEKRKPVWER